MSAHLPEQRRLRARARALGIETSYRNIAGSIVHASEKALERLVDALERDEQRAHDKQPKDSLDPVVVAEFGEPIRLTSRSVDDPSTLHGRVTVVAEDQTELEFTIGPGGIRPRSLGMAGEFAIDLGVADLPTGYYTLNHEHAGGTTSAHVLVRPPRAPLPPRQFGLFAPLYGLRSESDWGVGSFTELARLAQWGSAHGAAFVGTLPLYPGFYDAEFEVSPYRPVSRIAWNELYLDVATLPEIAVAPEATRRLRSASLRHTLEELRRSSAVEYRSAYAEKQAVIASCAEAIDRSPRRAAFGAYCAANPIAMAYARYRADRAGGTELERRRTTRFHEYAQFAADSALADVVDGGVPLYLDLPIGVHPGGFDPVHFSSSFLSGVSVGAPPDDFFLGGQDWGVPALDPIGMQADGFAYFAATLRHLFSRASVVRIDHVMGLERCFVIPEGEGPTDGAYLRYPSAALRAVAAIEAARSGTVLVGEDLGTVPPATHRAMARDGMLGSAVFEVTASGERPTPSTPARAIASFGTHDLPRFHEFIDGDDITRRERAGGESKLAVQRARADRRAVRNALVALGAEAQSARADGAVEYRGFLGWLAETRATIGLVDLGDVLGDREPENRPGPDSGATSWRHRCPASMSEIESSEVAAARLEVVAAGRPARAAPGVSSRRRGGK